MKRWAWIGILAVAGTASAQSIEALAHLVRSHGGEVMLSELDRAGRTFRKHRSGHCQPNPLWQQLWWAESMTTAWRIQNGSGVCRSSCSRCRRPLDGLQAVMLADMQRDGRRCDQADN